MVVMKQHHPQHSLLKYAGILNDAETDEMLTVINKTKNNKKNWQDLRGKPHSPTALF